MIHLQRNSVPMAKCARSDVAGKIPIPVAEPVQVHVTAGKKLAACRARLALVERVVLQLRSTSEMDLTEEAHVGPIVYPELIMQEQDWVNHGKDEKFFDSEMVALAKQEELKFEKQKVYEVVKEERVQK